jgi:hypothetical protein
MFALPAVPPGAAPAVTMQELELEHAELLPARETLYSWSGSPRYTGGPVSVWNPGGAMMWGPPRYTGAS